MKDRSLTHWVRPGWNPHSHRAVGRMKMWTRCRFLQGTQASSLCLLPGSQGTHMTIETCGIRRETLRLGWVPQCSRILSALVKRRIAVNLFSFLYFQTKVFYSKEHWILERKVQWMHVSLWLLEEQESIFSHLDLEFHVDRDERCIRKCPCF